MNERAHKVIAFGIPLLVFVLTLNGKQASSGVDTSILGMQYSMWKYHSFSLGSLANPVVQTPDAGIYNGSLYSALAPGFAILSYPLASLGFALDGGVFHNPGFASLFDEVFLAVASSVSCYVTYLMCRAYAGPRSSLVAALTLAFATPAWPFATSVFPNDASLIFSTLSVYFAVTAGAKHLNRRALSAGFSLGLAVFVEYATGLFAVPLVIYLARKKGLRSGLVFVAGFFVGPALSLVYNYSLFANPFVFPEQLKVGSSTQNSILFGFNLVEMIPHAVFYFLSPYRGVVLLCPVVLLGLYELVKMSRLSAYSRDAFLFLGLFALDLFFYSAWRDWAGGLAYGPRFLVAGMPYLVVPIAVLLESGDRGRLRSAFLPLVWASILIQGTGALTTAYSAAGDFLPYQPLTLNAPWLLEGNLDSWWVVKAGLSADASVLFALVLLACILAFMGYLMKTGPTPSVLPKQRANLRGDS